jgi:hypothetical protein
LLYVLQPTEYETGTADTSLFFCAGGVQCKSWLPLLLLLPAQAAYNIPVRMYL